MTEITTHVLDTASGRPADGIPVTLDARMSDGQWDRLGQGTTDEDGRARGLTAEQPAASGTHRLTFDTGARQGFFGEVVVTFRVAEQDDHLHVPLLLSPYGYTVYKGS